MCRDDAALPAMTGHHMLNVDRCATSIRLLVSSVNETSSPSFLQLNSMVRSVLANISSRRHKAGVGWGSGAQNVTAFGAGRAAPLRKMTSVRLLSQC